MSNDPIDSAVTPPAAAPATPPTKPAAISPGGLIREARQAQHLSVDDLAALTKLARPTVEALERDDFAALLEPVYARGYYRKCAKVLGLDEKLLVDAYSSRVVPKSPLPPAKLRLASGEDLGSGNRIPVAMAIVVALGAIIFCAFLWLVRGTTTQLPQSLPPSISGATQNNAPAAATVTPPPAATATLPAEATTPAQAAPEPVTPATGADAAALSTAPATASAASAPQPSVAASATSPAVAPAAPAAIVGTGPLQIGVSADSWISIKDSTGKSLLRGLVKAGQRVAVDGQPPFDLAIGNAPAVKLQYRGQAVDLTPFIRDNSTARVRIPGSGQ